MRKPYQRYATTIAVGPGLTVTGQVQFTGLGTLTTRVYRVLASALDAAGVPVPLESFLLVVRDGNRQPVTQGPDIPANLLANPQAFDLKSQTLDWPVTAQDTWSFDVTNQSPIPANFTLVFIVEQQL